MKALANVVYYFQRIIADIIAIFNDFLAMLGMESVAFNLDA